MSLENFLPFVLAATLILMIPGPTIILVITQAMTHGRRSVIPLVAGVLMGDFTAMTLSLLGLGALLAASASLFALFKWIGVLYLLYLGITLWRSTPTAEKVRYKPENPSARALFKRSFIVTALNPKSIAFFVAFLPQFINPAAAVAPQLTVLGGTFLIMATINAALYALFAGQCSELIRKEKVRRWLDRCGGGALIGAGIVTAGMQRSS